MEGHEDGDDSQRGMIAKAVEQVFACSSQLVDKGWYVRREVEKEGKGGVEYIIVVNIQLYSGFKSSKSDNIGTVSGCKWSLMLYSMKCLSCIRICPGTFVALCIQYLIADLICVPVPFQYRLRLPSLKSTMRPCGFF